MSQQLHHNLINEELETKTTLTLLHHYNQNEIENLIVKIPHQAFYFPQNSAIVKLLQECFREKKPRDIIFLKRVLETKIEPQLLIWYLSNTTDNLSIPGLVLAIQELKELYFNRVAFTISDKISKLAVANDKRRILTLSSTLGSFSSRLFEQKDTNIMDEATDRVNSMDEFIPAPYINMANMISGFSLRDVSALGAKSGHCKTTFAMDMVTKGIQLSFLDKVLYISADEQGEMVARRIIAKDMRIKTSDMRHKRIVLDKREVEKAVGSVYRNKLIIIDNVTKPEDIATLILDTKPTQVIIDHIQELDYGDAGLTDNTLSTGLSRMKIATRAIGGNLFLLSQVKDKVIDERIEDKVPRPHDFLYGSDIRRKSRELMVGYWRYKDTYNKQEKDIYEIYIHKSTYSETGMLKFTYNPEYAEFTPIENASTEHKPHKSIFDE